MSEPRWIVDDYVLVAHQEQLAAHGGISGLRDPGLLSSALARPRHVSSYVSPPPDMATLAAEYGFGIARNHPFFDGNKRTALVVTRTFLRLNGQDFDAPQAEQARVFRAVAEGSMDAGALADWIRSHPPAGEAH